MKLSVSFDNLEDVRRAYDPAVVQKPPSLPFGSCTQRPQLPSISRSGRSITSRPAPYQNHSQSGL